MTADTLAWAHSAADGVIALACFVIASAFLVFAARNRKARLGRVFAVFSVLFTCGGVMHICESAGWLQAGLVFKTLTALSCALSAYLTIKCLPAARMMFARVAVIDRQVGERMGRLRTDPRYDTPEDRQWQETLSEIQDLARMAREVVTPEEV